MPPGPRPKPTSLKLLAGVPGHHPLPANEPKPKPKLPQAPSFLSPEAKKEWRRTGRRLLGLGLMTEIDGSALAAYCQTWSRWKDAEEKLTEFGTVIRSGASSTTDKDGNVVRSAGMLHASPYLAIAKDALAQMTRMLVEFGMTPSSRSRVKAEKPAVSSEDDAFFGPRAI